MIRYFHMSMRRAVVVLAMLQLTSTDAVAIDDAIVQKLKTGITRDAALALVGSEPDRESCRTTLGVKLCRLIWFSRISGSRLEVTVLADRLLSLKTCRSGEKACDD